MRRREKKILRGDASKTCSNSLKFTLASLVHELCIRTFLLTTLSTSVNRFIAKKRDSFRLYSHFHLRERLFARRRRLVGPWVGPPPPFLLNGFQFCCIEKARFLSSADSSNSSQPPSPRRLPSANLLFRLLLRVVSLNFVASYTRDDIGTRSQNGFFLVSRTYIVFVGTFFNSCGLILRREKRRVICASTQ